MRILILFFISLSLFAADSDEYKIGKDNKKAYSSAIKSDEVCSGFKNPTMCRNRVEAMKDAIKNDKADILEDYLIMSLVVSALTESNQKTITEIDTAKKDLQAQITLLGGNFNGKETIAELKFALNILINGQ